MFMLKLVWMHLVALRFMLCLMPQTGYIFPDEFFQSSEVMAGDILGLSSHLTWEWTSENPIRSILYPFLSSGIPFKLFMWWKEFFDGEQLVTPFIILVLPRCWMTIQSLLIDFFIYKIATQAFRDSLNGWLAMTLFASSYTTWVFCTRTFSNATETLCLAALLYLALPTKLKVEDKVDGKAQENSNTKPAVVADTGDDGRLTQTLLISMVTVCGFFIRTSFVAFALVPLLLWMLKDEWSIPSLVGKAFQLGVFALAWILALVLVDTAYHNPSHLTKLTSLGSFDMQACFDWITKLTLTPLNNVLYNSNVENLSQHGIHPCYTHLLVNLPIMFGPLALLLLFLGFRALFRPQKIEMNNFYLAFSIISPLAILSMIPHQEPRFILPLVVPLVVVLAQCFKKMHEHKIFFSLWALFNMAAFFAFGVLHQGGVLPSIDYIHSVVELEESLHGRGSWQRSSAANSCNLTFIYYHTYMPPRHLTDLSAISKSPARVRKCKVNVIDLAGSTPYLLFEKNIRTWLKNSQVFVVFPTSIPCEDIERLQTRFSARITFEYFPHFSGEDPPWKDNMLSCPRDDTTRPLGDYFDRLKLRSYRIEHAITFPVPMVKISPLPVAGESIVM